MSRTLLAVSVLILGGCAPGSGKTTSATATTGSGSGASTGSPGATSGNGSGSGTGGGAGMSSSTGGGITADNFNQLLNVAVCEFTLDCEGAAPYLGALCGIAQFADFEDLAAAADAGRVSLNLAKATTCLADYSSGTCNATLAAVTCGEAIVGAVSEAGACYDSSDCQSDGCAGNNSRLCAAGTCQAIAEAGDACGCPNCGSCNPSRSLVCFNGSCTPPQGPEQSCGASDPPCELALACIGGACVTLPVPLADPCVAGQGQCQTGTYCFQPGSGAGTCVAQVPPGSACNEDVAHGESAFSFADPECAGSHAVCAGAGWLLDGGPVPGVCTILSDVGGACVAPDPSIDAGAAYYDGCYGWLNCIDGGCARPPSSGPCDPQRFACDPTVSYCATATTTCQSYVPLGGTCNHLDLLPCGFEAVCLNSTCQSLPTCSPKF
jgi:hypothetical protein